MANLIEPEDVVPTAIGVVIGICILTFFVLLANGMGLQTVIDPSALPRQ